MSNKNAQTNNNLMLGLLMGLILGGLVTYLILSTNNETMDIEKSSEKKEPLYWVAPMDPNYRRDQPGQSPMGMDLIPYYGDEGSDSPGTISISPDVVNNLGVRTQKATSQKGTSTITGVGMVQYDEEQLFHIHPRVEGWIEKLYIKSSGEEVSMNQPLYDMYSPQLVNAQEEFILALKRNDSRFIKAAEERLKSLQFSSEQIARVKKSKTALQRVTFYSPNHGVVENLKIREGFYVKPGDTLMSIGALDDVWVEVDILEKQASLIRLNQPVTMKLDYAPGKTWIGFIDFIHPTLDPMTRTLKVRLRFENSDRALKPNMYASIEIDAVAENSKLMIPNEAVIRTGNSNRVVLALGDGMFKSVDVTLGYLFDDYIEVLDGLVLGDEVVTSAQFLLDSESSKTSDFIRMETSFERPQSVWVEAVVNNLMLDHNMINVTHQPIDQWDWPEMTMDFITASDVDLGELSLGGTVHLQIEEAEDGQYRITGIHIPTGINEVEVDHSGHDMSGSQMDHSKMDHSKMDHSANESDDKDDKEGQQ